VEWVTRKSPTSSLGTTLINPNRTSPGEESGNTVELQCWLITNRLIKSNVDVGVASTPVGPEATSPGSSLPIRKTRNRYA